VTLELQEMVFNPRETFPEPPKAPSTPLDKLPRLLEEYLESPKRLLKSGEMIFKSPEGLSKSAELVFVL